MISLNFRDSRPIYEQIKSGFIKLIGTGVIEADEKLPSVRELATSLAINPNTIQKAYAQLESEGYIYTVSGRGSFACSKSVVSDKRKGELMEDFEKIVGELMELSIDKKELLEMIDELYSRESLGGGSDD